MKEVTFATTNKGKFLSAKRVLKKYNIKVIQANIELPESQSSLEIIAAHKAKYAFRQLRKPVIAMDAGFFIHSLKGFPMMYVKPILQTIGIEGLLKLTEGKKRECEFREILCFADAERNEPKFFTRIVKGSLADKPSGSMDDKHWSELALIFIPENEENTMASMDDKEYVRFRKNVERESHFDLFGIYYSKLKT